MGDMKELLYRERGTFRVVQKGADGKPLEKEVPLEGLSLTDTAELEGIWKVENGSFLDALREKTTVERMLQVVWLAIRKVGKARLDLDRGDYALSFGETGDLFPAGSAMFLHDAFRQVLERSGYTFGPRPTKLPETPAAEVKGNAEPPKAVA